MEFKGSMVALVTPFKNGQLDEAKLKELVEFHIKNGTQAIVPCGTTGESATLSIEEHEKVVEVIVATAKKKILVIAGTGSNNTAEAVELTRHAQTAGADASLLISPYYNRPTQEGLYRHFRAVADAVKIPVILYNIASRTAVNIEPETFARLSRDTKNIVGVKEASGNLEQMSRIVSACGEKFLLISGDDALTLPIMSIGGVGVISVVANIIPRDVQAMCSAYAAGDLKKARELHYKMLALIKAMFVETNPGPVKYAMERLGMMSGEIRLPLCAPGEESRKKIDKALADYGLLK
ncbi:MAG: 4-hydroxy-tetrahydrodipicolinate synthase [Candidatus Omnitrophota bacterium]